MVDFGLQSYRGVCELPSSLTESHSVMMRRSCQCVLLQLLQNGHGLFEVLFLVSFMGRCTPEMTEAKVSFKAEHFS